MTQPLFSILIANYNNGKYFADCYKSIIAQTYGHWEAIIVDDCSADDSVAQIKEIIGDDFRFKLILNTENRGCGFTKRRLAEIASGEICAFLDPDDAITKDALAIMIAEHIEKPDASIIYSKTFFCDEFLNIEHIRKSQQVDIQDPYFFNFDGHIFHFLTYKKKIYDQTIGINSYLQRAIDQDLVLKLYETGPAYLVDKAMYKYRIHKNGISTNQNQDKAYFWYWVTIIDAAKRRNVNIENLFIEKALQSRREVALEKEIASYNKSWIFKTLRKFGFFQILVTKNNL